MELLETHPIEFASDFRKFYGLSVFDIPEKVCWTEAWLMLQALKQNSESMLAVKLAGYTKTFNGTEVMLADLIDLTIAVNTTSKGKRKLYQRPWNAAKKLSSGSIPIQKGIEFFAKLGHKPQQPTKD